MTLFLSNFNFKTFTATDPLDGIPVRKRFSLHKVFPVLLAIVVARKLKMQLVLN